MNERCRFFFSLMSICNFNILAQTTIFTIKLITAPDALGVLITLPQSSVFNFLRCQKRPSSVALNEGFPLSFMVFFVSPRNEILRNFSKLAINVG